MASISMNQSPEDQFLHWRQDMEKKQQEQARQMKELQGHVERLQRENHQLRAEVGKSHDLGRNAKYSGRVAHPITSNKGKELIVPSDVDIPEDDELSSGSSLSLGLSPAKDARTKLRKRPFTCLQRYL